jgi:hypothetical protein
MTFVGKALSFANSFGRMTMINRDCTIQEMNPSLTGVYSNVQFETI